MCAEEVFNNTSLFFYEIIYYVNNMKKKIFIILLIILIIVAIIIHFQLWFKSTKLSENFILIDSVDLKAIEPNESFFKEVNISQSKKENHVFSGEVIKSQKTGMFRYQNKDIGISFLYPDNLIIRTGVSNGSSGRLFSGFLEFRTEKELLDGISFGGVTNNFIKSRGGSIHDMTGWKKEGDKYYLKFIWGDYEIVPSEFIPINSGQAEALIVKNTEIGMVLNEKNIAAFINIPDSSFSGIVFVLKPSRDSFLREKDIELFFDLISSINFEVN